MESTWLTDTIERLQRVSGYLNTWSIIKTHHHNVKPLENSMKKLIQGDLLGGSLKGYFHFVPGERVQTIFSEIFE